MMESVMRLWLSSSAPTQPAYVSAIQSQGQYSCRTLSTYFWCFINSANIRPTQNCVSVFAPLYRGWHKNGQYASICSKMPDITQCRVAMFWAVLARCCKFIVVLACERILKIGEHFGEVMGRSIAWWNQYTDNEQRPFAVPIQLTVRLWF